MRHSPPLTIIIIATALLAIGALAPAPAPAQSPADKPGPYKAVAAKPPKPLSDASFEAFRKQLAAAAAKQDRAALARMLAANFFWVPEDTDVADKAKSAVDNLAKAIGLEGQDAAGWAVLAEYAGETTGNPDPQRPGVICAPGQPEFDEKAADELANATQTDASDWVYPLHDGIELRSGPQQNAAVIERLGLYLLRALDDDSPANAVTLAFVKVLSPAGKSGYVPVDTVRPVIGPQMCYLKDASGWKIAGFLGGDPSHAN